MTPRDSGAEPGSPPTPGNAARDPSPQPGSHGRLTAAARLLIAATVAVMFALCLHRGFDITAFERSATSVDRWSSFNQREECIYAAIRSELPRGATVFIYDRAVTYRQELTELSTLWAIPRRPRTTAQWMMTLVRGQECVDVTLKVHRR